MIGEKRLNTAARYFEQQQKITRETPRTALELESRLSQFQRYLGYLSGHEIWSDDPVSVRLRVYMPPEDSVLKIHSHEPGMRWVVKDVTRSSSDFSVYEDTANHIGLLTRQGMVERTTPALMAAVESRLVSALNLDYELHSEALEQIPYLIAPINASA